MIYIYYIYALDIILYIETWWLFAYIVYKLLSWLLNEFKFPEDVALALKVIFLPNLFIYQLNSPLMNVKLTGHDLFDVSIHNICDYHICETFGIQSKLKYLVLSEK